MKSVFTNNQNDINCIVGDAIKIILKNQMQVTPLVSLKQSVHKMSLAQTIIFQTQ